jgi:hypothetical protein
MIHVDEEVYVSLQGNAQPFVDTPNTVLRRLLKLGADSPSPADPGWIGPEGRQLQGADRTDGYARARPGTILPHEAYVLPILMTLADGGGTAPSRDVVREVGRILAGDLTPKDRERLPSGWIRWENRVHWVRLQLVERGFLSGESPRGIWALTDAGRGYLASDRKGGA